MTKNPRGAVVLQALVVAIFTIVAGPIVGALIGCAVGLFCGGGGSDGGGGGGGSAVQEPCTSGPNACGMTNNGFVSGGSCNADVPSNSSCPAPGITSDGGFYSNPNIIGAGMSSTLFWTATDATACDITSDGGFSALNQPASGSISTGSIAATVTFSLTCENGDGGPSASASTKVVVDPHFIEL